MNHAPDQALADAETERALAALLAFEERHGLELTPEQFDYMDSIRVTIAELPEALRRAEEHLWPTDGQTPAAAPDAA